MPDPPWMFSSFMWGGSQRSPPVLAGHGFLISRGVFASENRTRQQKNHDACSVFAEGQVCDTLRNALHFSLR
jgi:hypothetical protein